MDWFNNITAKLSTVGLTFIIIFVIAALLYIILKALSQGREISFWPPKIGPKKESNGASRISYNIDHEGLVDFPLTKKKQKQCYIINNSDELIDMNISIINNAKKILVFAGSRSRDIKYMRAIEEKILREAELVIYRVLWGNPHYTCFRDHLINLLDIRDPRDRRLGKQTIHIGIFEDHLRESEKFICANEDKALVVLPSFSGVGNYDTALVLTDKDDVNSMIRYTKELYSSSTFIDEKQQVIKLRVIRESNMVKRSSKSNLPHLK